jgi:hypothetical protein
MFASVLAGNTETDEAIFVLSIFFGAGVLANFLYLRARAEFDNYASR